MTSEKDDSDLELDNAGSEADEPHTKRRRLSSSSVEAGNDRDTKSPRQPDDTDNASNDTKESTGEKSSRGTPEDSSAPAVDGQIDTKPEEQEEGSDSHEEADADEEEVEDAPVVPVKPAKNKKKKSIHRKDIRKIMTVDQLDEETLAAQKEEAERLQRIAEKQQNLRQGQAASASLMPVSLEDAIKGISDNGMTLSLSDLYDDLEIPSMPDDEPNKEEISRKSVDTELKEKETPKIQVEPEVYVLSSDDDEPQPQSDLQKPSTNGEGPTKIDNDFCKTSGGVVYSGNSTNIITLDDEEPSIEAKVKPSSPVQDESDDDCMVISPPPSDHELDVDEEAINKPDEFGRVLVNIGHPEGEPDIFLPQRIAEAMKPHQIGGVRFLYDNLVESIDRFDNSSGFGCIIAHSMGLGKTIQAAAFCEIFIRCTSARTVLVIVPINTIQNWSHEFNHWLPTEVNTSSLNSNSRRKVSPVKKAAADNEDLQSFTPKEGASEENSSDSVHGEQSEEQDPKVKKLNIYLLNETIKTLESREKIISEWGKEGGVLLIGYEMYRMLALRKLKKSTKKKPGFAESHVLNNEQDDLLDKIHKSLVRPGPDLVICDEGHRIKNSGASISQALKAIRTKRRVVLTGYPLQNNLMEYWCMVDFIRPNYLGTKAEFSNMFERPISNGQCADSTPQDRRLMQFRSHVLHSLLQGFVQRKSHAVLKRALPPKQEFVFLVKMSPIQYKLYKEYISYIQLQIDMGQASPNPIKAFAVCSKLWNHPDVLYRVMKKKQSALLDDLELEELGDEVKKLKKTTKAPLAAADYPDNSSPSNSDIIFSGRECIFTGAALGAENARRDKDGKQAQDSLLSLEWASTCFQDYTPEVLENGAKFELLFVIIEETLGVGDKLLIFSQSLLTLDLMETFLHAKYEWKKGQNYFRLDGSTQGLEREKLINEFNGDHSASVFLVSTKAGSLGVNLIGANRVVVFDASWNPCHDCQAVCRIYRYGQTKPCQIYRFVTDYTLEKQIYDRQIHKGGMANRVVDEMNPDSHINSKELLSTLLLEIRDLEKSQHTVIEHEGDKYSDGVIQTLLSKCGDKITRKPFEHESLLIDRKEKKLSAAERRMALRNYEIEKKAAANYTNGTGRGPTHTSGGGIVYPPRAGDTSGGWNSSSNYSSYSSYSRDSLGKPVASIRPYQRGLYDHDSVSMVPNTKPSGSSMNWPAVIEDLKKRGVLTTQVIRLRKNYVMPNPTGGSDIYLRPGDKLELIRAKKCSYIRLMNGQFMAMRRGSRGYTYLDSIPFAEELNAEQLGIFLSSFLREIPADYAEQNAYHSPLTFSASSSSGPSSSRFNTSSDRYVYGRGHAGPPASFPLPPSQPYSSAWSSGPMIQSRNKYLNSSGGGVKLWLKDHIENNAARRSANLVPDMELIKIGSSKDSASSRNPGQNHSAHFNSRLESDPSTSSLADQVSISRRNHSNLQPSTYSRSLAPNFGQSSSRSTVLQHSGGGIHAHHDLEIEPHHSNSSSSSSRGYENSYGPSYLPPTASSLMSRFLEQQQRVQQSYNPDASYEEDAADGDIQVVKPSGSRDQQNEYNGNGSEGRSDRIQFSTQEYHRAVATEADPLTVPSSIHPSLRHQYYAHDDEPIINNNDNLPPYNPLRNSPKVPDPDRFNFS